MSEHVREGNNAAPAPAANESGVAPDASLAALHVLGLQRTAGNTAVVDYLQQHGAISTPGDPLEQEADAAARAAMSSSSASVSRSAAGPGSAAVGDAVDTGVKALGAGEPLAAPVREYMEPRFGTDFSDVRVHTGSAANAANDTLRSDAFTYGSDVYYGAGRAPANDALTAHELAHVVQQRRAGQLAAKRIQPSFAASYPVALGVFEVDMQTREGALQTPPTKSGFDGYIRFVPGPDSPNSNQIVFVQIVKLTDAGGADVDSSIMAPPQAPRGALGDPGVRTQDDALRGVEGGYFTDASHRANSTAPAVPQGTPLSPNYDVQPAPPGAAPGTTVGSVQQPAFYGGGTGGVTDTRPGFKRSSDPADIRSIALYDVPGIASKTHDLNFDFESVVKGEDTMVVYGVMKWGFKLRGGHVIDEYMTPENTASATFAEALERHRDYYVHEPVTFYFAFNDDTLDSTELAKIDTFLDYLARNPTVRMSIDGYADIKGGASDYNLALSARRAEAVRAALEAKGIDPGRIGDVAIGFGASSSATADAGTGDQGGNAAVGADQSREANRWANRRVVLTFEQTASTPVGGAGP
ncbi:MAG TPA: DUF4157 domain-containing protein [Solirubrobacteraceae bacterium]|nr:DUF4157 domain-containing protein [Solirubrobacteraceae bacterium]